MGNLVIVIRLLEEAEVPAVWDFGRARPVALIFVVE
jgi:hypothetical protein